MWIFFSGGFVSATIASNQEQQEQSDPLMQVRGRCEEHVLAFCDAGDVVPRKIIETPMADYHWRAIMTKSEFVTAMGKISSDIEYGNFKNEARKQCEQNGVSLWLERVWMGCLHDIWGVMFGLQERNDRRQRGVNRFSPWFDKGE